MGNKGITKIRVFSGDNLNEVYKNVATNILEGGENIIFGDIDNQKEAREIFAIMQFHGQALKDILKGKVPRGFGYSKSQVKALMKTFVEEAQNPTGFEYTYPEILRSHPGCDTIMRKAHLYDQIELAYQFLSIDIEDRIKSNRNVGWIGNPGFAFSKDKPCFNWFQLRYMGTRNSLVYWKEIPMVSLRLLFRSHDYGDGVMANASSIGYGFNELVLKPLGAEMSEIIIISASAHVHKLGSQLIEETFGIKY
ncbi:MAG: hypothetical protein KAS66_08255 [Candidatus Omnitrophica bacterium]|nr:hypothetical protein [Candidatus Omnitrophota bacterium]